jgi:hypothetical protein
MGALAHRGGPVVGYDVVALDAQLAKYVAAAERNLGILEDLGMPLADKVKQGTAALDVEQTSIVYDRLVKAGLNLVKATDELSRLRSFLSGGPDTRPDLSSLGENELTAIFISMVRALGVTRVQQIIDAEVVS